ncbi:MAG: hypothetical protein IKF38_02195 [Clostridia bacterium]|nr:hypothetical protein [Clostridia bacterium]
MKFFKFIIIINIIFAIIAYFGICVYAENTTYVWSSNSNSVETQKEIDNGNIYNSNTKKEIGNSNTQNSSTKSGINANAETNTEAKSENETETSAEPESNSNPLGLESASAILIEQNSGQVLYEHNAHEQLRPASVTKVMSILLIMEQIDLRQT